MRHSTIMLACVLVPLGCGSAPGSAQDPPTEPTAKELTWEQACERYTSRCDRPDISLSECLRECAMADMSSPGEMCSFLYCGVRTELCDNEEPGDPTIMRCVEERGWLPER